MTCYVPLCIRYRCCVIAKQGAWQHERHAFPSLHMPCDTVRLQGTESPNSAEHRLNPNSHCCESSEQLLSNNTHQKHPTLLPHSPSCLLPNSCRLASHNQHNDHCHCTHVPLLNNPPPSRPRCSHPGTNRASPFYHLRLHVHRHQFLRPMQQFLRFARAVL